MGTETEIKLLAEPKALAGLAGLDLVQQALVDVPQTRRLASTYFDTEDGLLRKAGLTLRIRQIGRRYVQTIKAELPLSGDPASRAEWEMPVASDLPDLEVASETPMPSLLAEAGVTAAALAPRLLLKVTRRTALLDLGGGTTVEMAIDRGRIIAGTRHAPISEVELELKSGEAAAMFGFARALLAEMPFRLESRAKSIRGFALIDGPAPAERARAFALDPEMSAEAAFKRIAASCFQQIVANEAPALSGHDPEGVHQLRVGVRRMRSAISLFRAVLPPDPVEPIRERLRATMGAFGLAREWDVLLTETLDPLRARITDDPGLERLRRIAETARAGGHARLREELASAAYADLKLALLELIATDWTAFAPPLGEMAWSLPIGTFADRMLARRHKKLVRIGANHQSMSLTELHELRIAAKKLRYAADFFRSLYAKRKVRRYVAALAAVQDCLGAINDGAVGRARVAEASDRIGGLSKRSTRRARAEGAVEGWFAAVEHVELAAFGAAWRRYRDSKRFWRKTKPRFDPET